MELLISIPILFLFLLSYFIFFHGQHGQPRDKVLPRAYPIIGHLPEFLKNRHRLLDWYTELLTASPGHTFHLHLLPHNGGIITANPVNLEYTLKSNFDNYPKGGRSIEVLEDFLGHGIFSSDGEAWKAQRKTMSFEFTTKSLRTFVVETVQREIGTRLLPLLHEAAAGGGAVDFQDILERFAVDNICHVAFNEDPACLSKEGEQQGQLSGFAEAFRAATNFTTDRFNAGAAAIWKFKRVLNVGSERLLKKKISEIDGFAYKVIRARKDEMRKTMTTPTALRHHDILSRFMDGDENSDRYLRDVIVNIILAGRETTSSALSWFFWLVSQRPDVEAKILEEVLAVRRGIKRESLYFGYEDVKEMHYLHACLCESMRLYPPVPLNINHCVEDDVLPDGTRVGKGWFMVYCSYAIGRMRSVWGEDCFEFRPERWLDETGIVKIESQFKYPVFHVGPRVCLGKEMAFIQIKSVAASVIERFSMEVLGGGARPEMLYSLTLRMKGGLPVIFKERTLSA